MKAMGREVLQTLGLPDDAEPFDEELSPPRPA